MPHAACNQEAAQATVAGFGHGAAPLAFSRAPLARDQPHVRRHLIPAHEPAHVIQGRHHGPGLD